MWWKRGVVEAPEEMWGVVEAPEGPHLTIWVWQGAAVEEPDCGIEIEDYIGMCMIWLPRCNVFFYIFLRTKERKSDEIKFESDYLKTEYLPNEGMVQRWHGNQNGVWSFQLCQPIAWIITSSRLSQQSVSQIRGKTINNPLIINCTALLRKDIFAVDHL